MGNTEPGALGVDLQLLQVVVGRLSGLTTRLREAQEEVSPSSEALGDARVVDAWDLLSSRWRSVGDSLAADVATATRHLTAAAGDYAALEHDLARRQGPAPRPM